MVVVVDMMGRLIVILERSQALACEVSVRQDFETLVGPDQFSGTFSWVGILTPIFHNHRGNLLTTFLPSSTD
jgi:hypothetical protein